MSLPVWLDPEFCTRLSLTLLHSLWQMTVLSLLVIVLERLWLRKRVEWNSAVHVAALFAGLAAVPVTYALIDFSGSVIDARSQAVAPAVAVGEARIPAPGAVLPGFGPGSDREPTSTHPVTANVASLRETAMQWGVFLYFAGALIMLARLGWGIRDAQRLARAAEPVREGLVLDWLNSAAQRSSLAVVPALAVTTQVAIPQVMGLVRPTILLPTAALTGLTVDELKMILTHELAHIRRYDLWINLVQRLSEAALFFNPALWYLSRRISHLRELCCDELACRPLTADRENIRTKYALALLRVVELARIAPGQSERQTREREQLAALAMSGHSPSQLRRRIASLLGEPLREPVRVSLHSIIVALACIALLIGTTSYSAGIGGRGDQKAPEAVAEAAGQDSQLIAQAGAAPVPDGWELTLKAVDSETGQPIPGAEFVVQLRQEKTPYTADDAGACQVKVPSQLPVYSYLYCRAGGYAPMQGFWGNRPNIDNRDPLPAEVVFPMRKGISVGGVVLNDAGQPVAGATVEFSAGDERAEPGRRLVQNFWKEKFTTDDRGRWTCPFAPTVISSASIGANHADFPVVDANWGIGFMPDDPHLADLLAGKLAYYLHSPTRIRGRVTGPDGQPFSRAILLIDNTSDDNTPHFETDRNGNYEIPKSQTDRLTVIAAGFAPAEYAFAQVTHSPFSPADPPAPAEQIVDFQLKHGAAVEVRVVDSKGRPIPGVTVFPNNWQGINKDVPPNGGLLRARGTLFPSVTDENGSWRWESAPIGDVVHFDMFKLDYADLRNKEVIATPNLAPLEITLLRPQYLVGTVTDADTNAPIPDFVIQHGFVVGERFGGPTEGGVYWAGISERRGRNGNYKYTMSSKPNNGIYRYRALAEGYEPAVSQDIEFREAETRTLDFQLRKKAP